MNGKSEQFNVGEVVWAKVRGYPWWPATIAQVATSSDGTLKYTVNFVGENSHAIVSHTHIASYNKFYKEYSQTSNAGLKAAIVSANEMKLTKYFGGVGDEPQKGKKREQPEEGGKTSTKKTRGKTKIPEEESDEESENENPEEEDKTKGSQDLADQENKKSRRTNNKNIKASPRKGEIGTIIDLKALNKRLKECGANEEYTVVYMPVRVPKGETIKWST